MPAGRSERAHSTPAGLAGRLTNLNARCVSFEEPFRESEDPADDMSLGAVHAVNSGAYFAGQRRKAEQSAREHDARQMRDR